MKNGLARPCWQHESKAVSFTILLKDNVLGGGAEEETNGVLVLVLIKPGPVHVHPRVFELGN